MKYKFTKLFIYWLCCLNSCIVYAQGSITVTDHITVNEHIDQLYISLPQQQVELRETKSSRILVETTIKLPTLNTNLLNYLKTCGRYNLSVKLDRNNSELVLSANPNLNGTLMIKGKEVQETIHYIVYLPAKVADKVHVGEQVPKGIVTKVNK